MNNTILVTGATGTIGTEVVKILAEARVKVRAAVKSKNNSWKIPAIGVEVVEIDMDKPETLSNAFVEIEKLVLITPFNEKMVEYTKNLVQAAKNHGVKHIVKLSVMKADPNSDVPTRSLHGKCERIIMDSEIPWTFLRPSLFMQNFIRYHGESIRQKNMFMAPAEKAKVSFVDARDVAECVVSVVLMNGHENKIYTLTGPEAMDHRGFEHILSGVTGNLEKYYPLKPEEYENDLKNRGFPDFKIAAMSSLYDSIRKGDWELVTDDLRFLTSKKPRSLTQFSTDYRKDFRAK